jgi:hypothetical protein
VNFLFHPAANGDFVDNGRLIAEVALHGNANGRPASSTTTERARKIQTQKANPFQQEKCLGSFGHRANAP